MNETHVTVCGNLTADPEARALPDGTPVTSFRLASTTRRRNPDGSYSDGSTSYYKVSCFRWLARNVEATLAKGMPVMVHGRQRVAQWTTAAGTRSSGVEIEAYAVGPDLNRLYGRLTKGTAPGRLADPLDDPAVRAALEAMEEDVVVDEHRVDPRTGEVRDSPETRVAALLAAHPEAADVVRELELTDPDEIAELVADLVSERADAESALAR